ncbi:hypothetical protein ACV3RY_14945 [Clostridium perfringens]
MFNRLESYIFECARSLQAFELVDIDQYYECLKCDSEINISEEDIC